MTDTSGAAPAAAVPAAPAAPAAGAPTHVTQAAPTGYQPQTPPAAPAAAEPPKAGDTPPVDNKTAEPPQTPAKDQPPVDNGEFKLPDEYKDKAWAAKVKNLDDVYKQIDTLDALKGKKTVVPNLKEATPEEREAFYSQLRGKDAAEYPIPENPAFPTPPETQGVVAKLFMDNGVSPTQAEAIIKGYQELGAKQLAQQFDPEAFKTSMETAFGADWEKTTGATRNMIKGMMSPEDQQALDRIPNNILGTVYRTLGTTIKAVNETLAKYGAKESFAHLTAPNGKTAPTDIAAQRQGMRDQLAALSMRPHTEAEKQVLIDKIAASYQNDPRLQERA